jgi:hypothetical protein
VLRPGLHSPQNAAFVLKNMVRAQALKPAAQMFSLRPFAKMSHCVARFLPDIRRQRVEKRFRFGR